MGSKAIYSEVVELVLNIDRYKTQIDKAAMDLTGLKAKLNDAKGWEIKLATNSYKTSIDEAIRLERELKRSIEASNIALMARRNSVAINDLGGKKGVGDFLQAQQGARTAFDTTANSHMSAALAATNAHNDREAAKRRVEVDKAANDKRLADTRAYYAELDRLAKHSLHNDTQVAKSKADADKAANDKRLADTRAYYAELDRQGKNEVHNVQQVASAKSDARKRGIAAADEEARKQRELMRQEKQLADAAISNAHQVSMAKAASHRRARESADAVARSERELMRIEEARAKLQGTMGYRFGNAAAKTRLSDSIGMAAGGSFLLGNTNIGGALYMVERLARHTELGKKKLGELTEGFMGVTTGANASTTAVAAFGTSLMSLAGVVATIAAPIGAMFAGNKLDNAVANMSTLLADATVSGTKFSDMMNTAANSASRVGESFGIGLVDTVNGFKTALSTGIDASQLEEFGTIAATVTKGLGTTFEDATGILTTFRDSYQLSMGEMKEVSDVLFNAINVGKFQVDDLKNNIGRVVTASAEAGVSFKDMSAGLATLTRVGLSTSQSITSMNRFIQNIVSPTDQAKAAFDRLGLATGHAAFKTQTLMQYLQKLKGAVGNNADLMGELFSTEQGRRGAIGLTTNLGLTGSIRTAMDDVGTATIAANRAMDTFSQNFGKIFQTIWDVVQLVGRDLLQAANDVFFPGGPLSADSMTTFKNVLEAIGLVVKEVGVVIIGVAGTIFNAFKVIGSTIMGVVSILKGDFTAGVEMIGKSVVNMVKGIGNSVANVFTTIHMSADRVGANIRGIDKSSEEATKRLTDSNKEAIKSIFGDDLISAMDAFSTKAVSKYDKILDAIRKTRLEAAKLAWEQANPVVASSRPPDDVMTGAKLSESDLAFLKKYKIGKMIRDGVIPTQDVTVEKHIRDAGGIDPDSERAKQVYEAITVKMTHWAKKRGEELAKAEVEARAKAMREAMTALGYGDLLPAEGGPKKPTAAGNVAGDNVLKQLEEAGTAIKALTEDTPLKTKIGWIMELGKQVPIFEEITDKVRKLELAKRELVDAEQAFADAMTKNELTPEQITANKNTLEQMTSDVKKAEASITKEKMDEYTKRYKYERKLHDLKLEFIETERKKLQELRENNKDDMKDIVSELQDIRSKERPGSARREYKDAAEADIRRAGQAKDPKSIDDFLDSATDLLKKMVETGDSPERAERDRKDLLLEIFKMREKADKKFGAAESSMDAQKNAEDKSYQNRILDNPVAQASIKEATRIMQEMATEAAKRGINMSGDLVSTVDIKVDANIPMGALRDAVVATVKEEMTRIAIDIINKKQQPPSTGGNLTPPGAP